MPKKNYSSKRKIELWGGAECSIIRIGDNFTDQLADIGHYDRPDDFGIMAGLHVKKLRFPILWEHHEVIRGHAIDWSFVAGGLNRLKQHRIQPIVGLLHHGSGPAFTNLMDDRFPEYFAEYARQVAERFPDVTDYSPINEPLTTSRFSGLYGLWYPHQKSPSKFFRMLINQLKGVVLAMSQIRKVNPAARLIQTEDLAKVHATEILQYQADFENCRRWLTFDLLCGKVDVDHEMYDHLVSLGISAHELQFFQREVCPPDLLGLNYYVTSERYLDHRLEQYPGVIPGGNDIHAYVDVEAVRCEASSGLETLLREVWERYKIPMAITEAHLACTREEQLRWFKGIWDSVSELSVSIDIRAVTVWSIFGAFDWDSLVTQKLGHYESGAFEIIDDKLRPTAVAIMISSLAKNGNYDHPVLHGEGWWQRGLPVKACAQRAIIFFGNDVRVRECLERICNQRSIRMLYIDESTVDVENMFMLLELMTEANPWAVIEARTSGAGDYGHPSMNDDAGMISRNIAMTAALQQVPLMVFSFSSAGQLFCNEPTSDSKQMQSRQALWEASIIIAKTDALIIRATDVFSPWTNIDSVSAMIDNSKIDTQMSRGRLLKPTYLPMLINRSLDLLIDAETGIWNLAHGDEPLSESHFELLLSKQDHMTIGKRQFSHHTGYIFSHAKPRGCSNYSNLGWLVDAVGEYHRQLNEQQWQETNSCSQRV